MKDTSLYELTALSVERYLELTGWIRDYRFQNRNLMVFYYNGNRERQLAVPASEKFADFYIRLKDVLKSIGVVENRSWIDIVEDINSTISDRLEFRIISDASSEGKLPLDYATNCINGLRELILYSACAENNPKPVCQKYTLDAKRCLEGFNLGQTEVGSFIFKIDSQVVDNQFEQTFIPGFDIIPPVEHKVIERIYTAMEQVSNILQKDEPLTSFIQNAFEDGITANMCDAFLKLRPDEGEVEIETTVKYAAVLVKEFGQVKKIKINNKDFLMMGEIARLYRDTQESEKATLTGRIQRLSKGPDKTDEIQLYTEIDGENRHVKLILTQEDHVRACEAYRDNKTVRVSGLLDRSKKKWFFAEVSDFIILY